MLTIQTPISQQRNREFVWVQLCSKISNLRFRQITTETLRDTSYIDKGCFEVTQSGILLLNSDLDYNKLDYDYVQSSIHKLEYGAFNLRALLE